MMIWFTAKKDFLFSQGLQYARLKGDILKGDFSFKSKFYEPHWGKGMEDCTFNGNSCWFYGTK